MTQVQAANRWYKEPWPWILMAGPFIVVIAGFVTAWLAIRSNDGLVADDYYKQGLAINQQLGREHKAGELGVQGELMRSGVQVRLFLRNAEGAELPSSISLRLAHPTRGGLDQTVALSLDAPGMYSGKLSADISGRWRVILEDGKAGWRLQSDWNADVGEPLRLVAGTDK